MDPLAAAYFLADAGFWLVLILVAAVFVVRLIDETLGVIRQHWKEMKAAAISRPQSHGQRVDIGTRFRA